MTSDIALFPSKTAVGDLVWQARARSVTYRILSGAGRAEMFIYRPEESRSSHQILHGMSAAGDLMIVVPGFHDVDTSTPAGVRVSIEKEAPNAGIQVIAASVHLLAEAHWLSAADKEALVVAGGVNETLAEMSQYGAMARLQFDIALLHDCVGVTRVSSDEVRNEREAHVIERECAPLCATEDLFAEASSECTAVDVILASALMESGAVLDRLLFGECEGSVIGRQPVANPCAHSLGTLCLDVDRTGVTLMCIEGSEATTVFLPFPTLVSTRKDLQRAVAAIF